MTLRVTYALLLLAACGNGVQGNPGMPPDGSRPDAPGDGSTLTETQPLGMNDISMINPTMLEGIFGKMNGVTAARDLVPRDLFQRLVTAHDDIQRDYNDFVIFAIRFDLCDRVEPGPCPIDADGSLRLVLQPLRQNAFGAADVGLHAFYPIPAADLGYVINELRAIARIFDSGSLVAGPLVDNHIGLLAGIPRLQALLDRYALPDHLIRLALMGQDVRSTTPRVVFRMLELQNGEMVDFTIPTIGTTEQVVAVDDSNASYAVTPLADSPTGTALALSSDAFAAADAAAQRAALDSTVAADNPRLHTPHTVQCAACHTSTYVEPHRAPIAGVDIRNLPNFFHTTRDVSVSAGIAATTQTTLHAFGWIGGSLSISQRVANETTVVLDEIEQRFPARHDP